MKNALIRCIPLLALLLLPETLGAAQETQGSPATQTIRYDIHFLDLHGAEVLAWDQCAQKERCRVSSVTLGNDPNRKGYLEVGADPAVQEKVVRALAKADTGPRTQRFQILLLAATTKAGVAGPEIPANAGKALADLKKILPFKSYQLVDASWLSATEGEPAQGRMAGGGTAYEVKLRFQPAGEPGAPSLFMDHFQLAQEIVVNTKDGPHYDHRHLIETTFSLKEGETMVVGTSKADGTDGALVVLLTAVPAS
jgi:hypothetical protein